MGNGQGANKSDTWREGLDPVRGERRDLGAHRELLAETSFAVRAPVGGREGKVEGQRLQQITRDSRGISRHLIAGQDIVDNAHTGAVTPANQNWSKEQKARDDGGASPGQTPQAEPCRCTRRGASREWSPKPSCLSHPQSPTPPSQSPPLTHSAANGVLGLAGILDP